MYLVLQTGNMQMYKFFMEHQQQQEHHGKHGKKEKAFPCPLSYAFLVVEQEDQELLAPTLLLAVEQVEVVAVKQS